MLEPASRTRRGITVGVTGVALAVLAAAMLAGGCQRDGDVGGRGPTPPGSGEQQLHSGSGPSAIMTTPKITPDLLRTWSEQLCTQPALDFPGALRALGIPGSLVARSSDFSIVEPPPPGTSRVGLTLENLGKNKGYLSTVDVTLDGVNLPRAEIDQRFGPGDTPPRVDYDRPYVVSYQVNLPGAPYRVTVSASFGESPGAASSATKISMRRDVVKPPAPAKP